MRGASENNRRAKFYRLTALGRLQLEAEHSEWRRFAEAVKAVLDVTGVDPGRA